MDPTFAAWLASTVEEPLEPDLPICDPHHHLWDHPTERFLLEELRAETGSGHNVVETVYVDCMSGYRAGGPPELAPVGESEFAAEQAARSERTPGARIAAIVGFADLTLGDKVASVLEAHLEAAGGRFRGIRHATGWDASPQVRNSHTDPPPGLLADATFRRGLRTLGEMGLSFDAWLYHPQLPELADVARAHPEVTIVVDHLGGPLGVGPYAGRRAEVLEAWRPAMAEVASCPNVVLKVGGIGMPLYGIPWHRRAQSPSSDDLAAAWSDEIRFCIDRFGPSRCMFESNFPVDRRGCSYLVLWNAFKKIAARGGYSPGEQADLFRGCATRTYRIT